VRLVAEKIHQKKLTFLEIMSFASEAHILKKNADKNIE
jgi:hypothetical protein